MIKIPPKTANKRRQNPWYKNQVSSLNGRHSRLADRVRALKAYANSTENSLRETQQELAFAMEQIREMEQDLIILVQTLKRAGLKIDGWNPSSKGNNQAE